MRIPFLGSSYTSQSIEAADQRTMNLIPEIIETQDKTNIAQYPTPGLASGAALNVADDAIRAIYEQNGRVFVVGKTNLVELSSTYGVTVRGTFDAADRVPGPASVAASADQLLVATNGVAYGLDLAINNLGKPTGMLGPISHVGYLDGYFIALLKDTRRFQFSALADVKAWNGLDYAEVSTFPDNVLTILCDHRELWLFARTKTCVYWNSGDANNPIQPAQGGFIEQGCIAEWSPQRLDNSIFWLGGDERGGGVVWSAQGLAPRRVSNHALEHAIQGYARITDAEGYVEQRDGHSFYLLRFPSVVQKSVSAGSNAASAELTVAAHGLESNDIVVISAASGAWTPINGSFVVTKTGTNTFTIPVNSTAFGGFPAGVVVGTESATWVYDCATGQWHERGFWINSRYVAHRSRCHCYVPSWGAIAATGTLTFGGSPYNVANIPQDGDTLLVDTKTYTFKTVLTPAEGEIHIKATPDLCATATADAMNHAGTPGTDYSCAAAHPTVGSRGVVAHALVMTARTPGSNGNTIATTAPVGATRQIWTAATLGGGAEAPAVYNKHLVGDWGGPTVYESTASTFDDFGNAKRWLRRGPHIQNDGEWIVIPSLELDLEYGIIKSSQTWKGTWNSVTAYGVADVVHYQGSMYVCIVPSTGYLPTNVTYFSPFGANTLRCSDDGGHTWGNERTIYPAVAEQYKARAVWRRMGRTRDRVMEMYGTEAIPWRLLAVYLK